MTETVPPEESELPVAKTERSRWFGLVWAVPLAALLIVGYLGIQAFADRGIAIVITFNDATGVSVGDTKLIYQGVIGGKVTKIQINPDGHRVDVTLRVDRRAEPGLNSNTKFWLVGEKPDLSDISSVKAALLGLSIGVAPGVGGVPTRQFTGLDAPPVIYPGTKGTAYVLTANRLSSVKVGSSLFYHGQEIGRVTQVHLNDQSVFRIDIFVLAPFDQLVDASSMFWISSPFKVDVSGGQLNANVEHAGTLLTGGIEMDRPEHSVANPTSPAHTIFPLRATEDEARAGPTGPHVAYAFRFNGSAGDLDKGAPVRFLGFRVGQVQSVRLEVDPRTGAARTMVQADLFPARLGLQIGGPSAPADRQAMDELLKHLIARGYRARLSQKPPLIGGLVINLDAVSGSDHATLIAGDPPIIPSADAGSSIDAVTDQLSQILAKVNHLPIESIGEQIRGITQHLNQLLASPQLSDSLQHLDHTLVEVDQMATEVRPQIGPMVQKLDQLADQVSAAATAAQSILNGQGGNVDTSVPAAIQQLTEAARSVRTLADYLGRHPEALIQGKGKEQP